VPITLGQEFGGYAAQVREGLARIDAALPATLARSPLAAPRSAPASTPTRSRGPRAGHPRRGERAHDLADPRDPFEAQAARDGIVEASGALKTVAVSLTKIANDIRYLGSGPRAGLAEIALPELQKGSSIMPGKVNPVIPEVVTQGRGAGDRERHRDHRGRNAGHFELNVFVPLLARNILDSIKLLSSASRLFADKCVDGIEANRRPPSTTPSLTLSASARSTPTIGYDRVGEYREGGRRHRHASP